MRKHGFVLCAALTSALMLAGCNQPQQAEGPDALSALSISAFRGATVTSEGSTITAARAGEGNQGVTLRRSAVLVHFTVEGENARIRISRGDQDLTTRPAADNAVMIGPGGATAVSVFSSSGSEVKVNVTSVVDCATAPEGACQPPQFSGRRANEGEEAEEGAEPAPAAPTP